MPSGLKPVLPGVVNVQAVFDQAGGYIRQPAWRKPSLHLRWLHYDRTRQGQPKCEVQ
jgi:hypothetical protein